MLAITTALQKLCRSLAPASVTLEDGFRCARCNACSRLALKPSSSIPHAGASIDTAQKTVE